MDGILKVYEFIMWWYVGLKLKGDNCVGERFLSFRGMPWQIQSLSDEESEQF
jgi:hypothetical protein